MGWPSVAIMATAKWLITLVLCRGGHGGHSFPSRIGALIRCPKPLPTLATSLFIMKKNKNKEGVSRKSSGGHRGGHAVAMATPMATSRRRRLLARCQPERPPTLRVPDYSKRSFDLIRLRLVEAVETLRCLPLTGRDRPPKGLVSSMPPFVRQAWVGKAMAGTRPRRHVRRRPRTRSPGWRKPLCGCCGSVISTNGRRSGLWLIGCRAAVSPARCAARDGPSIGGNGKG